MRWPRLRCHVDGRGNMLWVRSHPWPHGVYHDAEDRCEDPLKVGSPRVLGGQHGDTLGKMLVEACCKPQLLWEHRCTLHIVGAMDRVDTKE